MASIDQYKHELLDFIECPSDYSLVLGNPTRQIAIYRLLEDVPDSESAFKGRVNDILIGGGSGEVPSLRVSQKGIKFFVDEEFDDFDSRKDLLESHWTPTFCFKLGNGFMKLGWSVEEQLEFWVAERVIKQLIEREKITVPNKK